MSQRNWLEPANFIIAILGLGVAIAGFTFKDVWKPVLFGKNERFSCELRPDTAKGGEVWTVMYRKNVESLSPDSPEVNLQDCLAERR